MAGPADPRVCVDIASYVAPAFAGFAPDLGRELTDFLYLRDKSQEELAARLRSDPAAVSAFPIVIVQRSLDFVLNAGASQSLEFNPNGGMNAIVLGFSAYAFDPVTAQAIDTGLFRYRDVESNRFEWVESTSLYNLAGSGQLPGVLFPLRYLGNSRHTITLTNQTGVLANPVRVSLSYRCAIVGRVGAY